MEHGGLLARCEHAPRSAKARSRAGKHVSMMLFYFGIRDRPEEASKVKACGTDPPNDPVGQRFPSEHGLPGWVLLHFEQPPTRAPGVRRPPVNERFRSTRRKNPRLLAEDRTHDISMPLPRGLKLHE